MSVTPATDLTACCVTQSASSAPTSAARESLCQNLVKRKDKKKWTCSSYVQQEDNAPADPLAARTPTEPPPPASLSLPVSESVPSQNAKQLSLVTGLPMCVELALQHSPPNTLV